MAGEDTQQLKLEATLRKIIADIWKEERISSNRVLDSHLDKARTLKRQLLPLMPPENGGEFDLDTLTKRLRDLETKTKDYDKQTELIGSRLKGYEKFLAGEEGGADLLERLRQLVGTELMTDELQRSRSVARWSQWTWIALILLSVLGLFAVAGRLSEGVAQGSATLLSCLIWLPVMGSLIAISFYATKRAIQDQRNAELYASKIQALHAFLLFRRANSGALLDSEADKLQKQLLGMMQVFAEKGKH